MTITLLFYRLFLVSPLLLAKAQALAAPPSKFQVERVSSKSRALDVQVFRQRRLSVDDFIKEESNRNQGSSNSNDLLSEEDALHLLTRDFDETGQNTKILGDEPVVQFIAALYQDDRIGEELELEKNKLFANTNGVIGAVDAILQHYKPFEDVDLSLPYVCLKNLRVDERMQRQGIASCLVQAVKDYAKKIEAVDVVILQVDQNNDGAIRLYENHGFEYQKMVDDDIRMVCSNL
jgi:RimJ/RimL family protein N-acetyltransferase